MNEKATRVLLVEDSRVYAEHLKALLTSSPTANFEIIHAERLADALTLLANEQLDIVLLDLILPDSQGFDTFVNVQASAMGVPVIVLTGMDDETFAINAVARGAQDYLVKGQVDANVLLRSIRYSIERYRLMAELRSLTFVDELTSLHNRRGFFTLAQQQLKIADRTKHGLILLFADLDKMKVINDTWGHHEGDQALKDTANVLKRTFRDSDIIARLGGDEFVVLAILASLNSTEIMTTRLQRNVTLANAQANRPYQLSISVGIIQYDPTAPRSLRDLLSEADAVMYEQKKGKGRA